MVPEPSGDPLSVTTSSSGEPLARTSSQLTSRQSPQPANVCSHPYSSQIRFRMRQLFYGKRRSRCSTVRDLEVVLPVHVVVRQLPFPCKRPIAVLEGEFHALREPLVWRCKRTGR